MAEEAPPFLLTARGGGRPARGRSDRQGARTPSLSRAEETKHTVLSGKRGQKGTLVGGGASRSRQGAWMQPPQAAGVSGRAPRLRHIAAVREAQPRRHGGREGMGRGGGGGTLGPGGLQVPLFLGISSNTWTHWGESGQEILQPLGQPHSASQEAGRGLPSSQDRPTARKPSGDVQPK